jgi:hypothetical protein
MHRIDQIDDWKYIVNHYLMFFFLSINTGKNNIILRIEINS